MTLGRIISGRICGNFSCIILKLPGEELRTEWITCTGLRKSLMFSRSNHLWKQNRNTDEKLQKKIDLAYQYSIISLSSHTPKSIYPWHRQTSTRKTNWSWKTAHKFTHHWLLLLKPVIISGFCSSHIKCYRKEVRMHLLDIETSRTWNECGEKINLRMRCLDRNFALLGVS